MATPVGPLSDRERQALAKQRPVSHVVPNLVDYREARDSFSWTEARRQLDGLPGGAGLNIAYEAVDRHAAGPFGGQDAFRFIARDGRRHTITYAELARQTNRFANALTCLGVGDGDVVVSLLGRVPALYVAALGSLKRRAMFSPFFSAFGPEPIQTRLTISRARVLVTTTALYRRKVAPIRGELPHLEHVLVVDTPGGRADPGTHSLEAALEAAGDHFDIPSTLASDPALLHFTSGTTGTPKGALHVHEAVVAHHATARFALDLHPGEIYWCTADPGWVTGTSYGIIAPLTNRVTSIVDEEEFDANRWYDILRDEGVNVWYTAPTAIRMMMKYGSDLARARHYPALRFLASVGEPLNPEAVLWGVDAFDLPFHDNWWQTETGGIMVANFAAMPIRPGSMGRPLPGIEAALVRRRPKGGLDFVTASDEEGELALHAGWPSMFRGYLHDDDRYLAAFEGDYYLTGDLARRDADGYYWFVGRADDVIKSSGHLIGPFEVESALLEHAAVAEAAAIGKPDPIAHEVVKAFVALKPGVADTPDLRADLLGFARTRLGPVVAPKEIAVVDTLPRTRSGKILRRLLKARELGLPEGDLSTLEPPS